MEIASERILSTTSVYDEAAPTDANNMALPIAQYIGEDSRF